MAELTRRTPARPSSGPLRPGWYASRPWCTATTPAANWPGTLSGLKTVGFWDADHDQAWGLDWHRNEGLELTFLETGTLAFSVDATRCQLHPNDLTITRPWQPHRVGNPAVSAGRLHWLILDLGVRRPHQTWQWPKWLILTRRT